MRSRTRAAKIVGSILAIITSVGFTPGRMVGQVCTGDCNNDGKIAITELITCVGIALGRSNVAVCPECDPDGNGRAAINELIKAVSNAQCGCNAACPTPPPPRTRTWTATPTRTPTNTPTPSPTPRGPITTAFDACDDDCRAAQQRCGDELFFEEYNSVRDCTDECVSIVESFASDVEDFDGCVDAQVRFIECCTARGQCGRIPGGCDREFNGAVNACGGSFGGCPLIFF